jgi:hypothetical protein
LKFFAEGFGLGHLGIKLIAHACQFCFCSSFLSARSLQQFDGAVNLLFQRLEIAGGAFKCELAFGHGSHEYLGCVLKLNSPNFRKYNAEKQVESVAMLEISPVDQLRPGCA